MVSPRRRKPALQPLAQTASPVEASAAPGLGPTLALLVLFGFYGLLFYATPLTSLPLRGASGQPLRRFDLQWPLLVRPEELVGGWFGANGSPRAILDRLPIALVAALILATAVAAGRLLLDACRVRSRMSRLEQWVFSTAAGLHLVSLATLAIGLLGGLHCRLLFALPSSAVIGLACWRWRRVGWKEPASDRPAGEGEGVDKASWLQRRGAWLALPFVLVLFLGAMLPPWDFDVREYHLQAPKEWYLAGRITFLPHNVYANMPLGAEMHALFAMAVMRGPLAWWWGALAGKAVIAAYAPLTALGLVAAGRRFYGGAAGVAAGLIYISTAWIAQVSMAGLIDGAAACYLFLAFYAVLLWFSSSDGATAADSSGASAAIGPNDARRRSPGLLLLAGFLTGSAAACKYPGFLLVAAPLLAFLLARGCWKGVRRGWSWETGRPAALFLLALFLGCGLWLGKNMVVCGNPVYPLCYRWLDGRTRTPEKDEQWRRAHQTPRDAQGRRYSLGALAQSVARAGWRSEWLSPLPVPFALVALFAMRRRRTTLTVLGMLIYAFAAWWLATHRIDRFLLPALPLLALLAGAGATAVPGPLWRRAVLAVLILGLLSNFLVIASPMVGDNRYFVALETLREDEPAARGAASRVHPAHRYLNRRVGAGEAVLLVGDAQPFDLEIPVYYNTCFDDCIFQQLMEGRSRGERQRELRRRRIRWVFFDWREMDRYRATYGFTDYVTRARVREEFAGREGILRKVPLDLPADVGELYEITDPAPLPSGGTRVLF